MEIKVSKQPKFKIGDTVYYLLYISFIKELTFIEYTIVNIKIFSPDSIDYYVINKNITNDDNVLSTHKYSEPELFRNKFEIVDFLLDFIETT